MFKSKYRIVRLMFEDIRGMPYEEYYIEHKVLLWWDRWYTKPYKSLEQAIAGLRAHTSNREEIMYTCES